ncbi:MAG: ribose 5-phosphate isomerase B [Firmicutes bacterium]|nr:ribose 5-phosphate isomerase B [Bacillota bacterium]
MKLIIGNDHKGTQLKNKVVSFLKANGYDVIDLGVNEEMSVDYPKYAFEVTNMLLSSQADFGILICGTGIGMSIAANKVKGIRCALVHNAKDSALARKHNDANVLALSSKTSFILAKKIITTFLNTSFSNEERHINRINMIKEYEKDA